MYAVPGTTVTCSTRDECLLWFRRGIDQSCQRERATAREASPGNHRPRLLFMRDAKDAERDGCCSSRPAAVFVLAGLVVSWALANLLPQARGLAPSVHHPRFVGCNHSPGSEMS